MKLITLVESFILTAELIQTLCVLIVCYMLCVYIHCFVWEEIGDVLHGLGEDKGWTSKPDIVWEEIGDGLH